jgi:hypothetical protein
LGRRKIQIRPVTFYFQGVDQLVLEWGFGHGYLLGARSLLARGQSLVWLDIKINSHDFPGRPSPPLKDWFEVRIAM